MRQVSTKELSGYKILPFDLYNEANGKVLNAGEVLTPGKLIMLKNYAKLFTEELYSDIGKGEKASSGRSNAKKMSNFSYDTLDTADFETVINRDGVLKTDTQVKIKFYLGGKGPESIEKSILYFLSLDIPLRFLGSVGSREDTSWLAKPLCII